jgi:hypothetical protein
LHGGSRGPFEWSLVFSLRTKDLLDANHKEDEPDGWYTAFLHNKVYHWILVNFGKCRKCWTWMPMKCSSTWRRNWDHLDRHVQFLVHNLLPIAFCPSVSAGRVSHWRRSSSQVLNSLPMWSCAWWSWLSWHLLASLTGWIH